MGLPLHRRRAVLGLVLLGLAGGGLARFAGLPALTHGAWDAPSALVAAIVAMDLVAGLRHGTLGVDVIALLAILVAPILD